MTVGDLIKDKDYDYICWRIKVSGIPGCGDIFAGSCKSKNGELISLDGDSYSKAAKVFSYEEFSDEKVENGLVVIT